MNYDCKYCLTNDSQENLINPCSCQGSMRYVHEKCLEKWVNDHHRLPSEIYDNKSKLYKIKCEICNYDIKYNREYRNSIIKSLFKVLQSILTSAKNLSLLGIHGVIIYFFVKRIGPFLLESLLLLKRSFNPEEVMKLIHNIYCYFENYSNVLTGEWHDASGFN